MSYVWFLTVAAIWGSSFMMMKRAAVCLSPASIGVCRMASGVAVLLLVWLWGRRRWTWQSQDRVPLLLAVVLGFAWPYTIQPFVIQRTQLSGLMSLLVGLTPLLTMLVSLPILHLRPSRRQLIGVCGAFLFLAILFREGLRMNVSLFDLALACTVPLGYAIANAIIRRSLRHLPVLELTVICLCLGSVLLLPWAIQQPYAAKPVAASLAERAWVECWLATGLLGVVGTGLGMCLFNHLVKTEGPLFASMVTNLTPLIALLWGWTDGEAITVTQLWCMAGIISMVALVNYPEKPSIEDETSASTLPAIVPDPIE